MAVYNVSYNSNWLDAIVSFAEKSNRDGALYKDFLSYGYDFERELQRKGLPRVSASEYLPVWGVLTETVEKFIADAANPKEAAGALFWRLLKSSYNGSKVDASNFFRKERIYQRNMINLLNCFKLDLSAKDKINALAFLDYKYTTDEYLHLYQSLGEFNLGENPENLDYERTQTVRLFGDIFKNSQKSTWKNKVSSVAVLLESIARNASFLEGVSCDGVEIDDSSRAKMLAIMKKSHHTFSLKCLTYFSASENTQTETNTESYMAVVLNKLEKATDVENRRMLLNVFTPKVNVRVDEATSFSDRFVENYGRYLNLIATNFPKCQNIPVDKLEALLAKNANEKNMYNVHSSLFPGEIQENELPPFDKKLVLKVARNYVNSFNRYQKMDELNFDFYEKMTQMLGRIVTSGCYKKNEVRDLCQVLCKGDEPLKRQMAKKIMTIYTASEVVRSRGGRS